MRKNPRHGDVIRARIANTYQLLHTPAALAKFIVVPGKPPRKAPDGWEAVHDMVITAVLTSTSLKGLEKAAASLEPGHYTIFETSGQRVVGADPLEVK